MTCGMRRRPGVRQDYLMGSSLVVAKLPDGVGTRGWVICGLLFAATELAVYVSFNDGDHWQPLRLNMPATSIRDVIVSGGDPLAMSTERILAIEIGRAHV